MPIIIPEFVQFQGVLYPLRGLWNTAPAEGDRFVNAEIDWGSPGLLGVSCVQFQLSGNSPVAFSQIVAISVDNSRCGSDVDFIFPDSGFILTVPGFNQGVYPVFTNALMFYVNAPLAVLGDITIAQILNSMPPPVAIQPSSEQEQASVSSIPLTANSSTPLLGTGISGTLFGFSIPYAALQGAAEGGCFISLTDGTGRTLWQGQISLTANQEVSSTFTVTGLRVRFTAGINFVVSGFNGIVSGTATPNIYYSVP